MGLQISSDRHHLKKEKKRENLVLSCDEAGLLVAQEKLLLFLTDAWPKKFAIDDGKANNLMFPRPDLNFQKLDLPSNLRLVVIELLQFHKFSMTCMLTHLTHKFWLMH